MEDVIIVGGGPAGSSLAIFLGKLGIKSLLLDKAKFPRDKICGDSQSPILNPQFEKLGIKDRLQQSDIYKMSGGLLSYPNVGDIIIGGVDATKKGYVCKREKFDAILLSEAKKYASIMEDTKVIDLLFKGEQVVGVKTNKGDFHSKIVVGADGALSVVAQKLGVLEMDNEHTAIAARAYYSGVGGMTNLIELHFLKSVHTGYFWIFPLDKEKKLANVGVGMLSKDMKEQNINLKTLLEDTISVDPLFKDRFTTANKESEILGWSLPLGSTVRRAAFDGALLTGDAAALINPLSGEGVDNAIKSAEICADVIYEAIQAEDFSRKLLKRYEKKLNLKIRPMLRFSYFIQKTHRNKKLALFSFSLMKRSKLLRKIIVKAVALA